MMTKLFTLVFSVLSLATVWLTYADTGLQTIDVIKTTKSVRQGSSSSSSSGGGFYSSGNGSGGGYRHGK
ncbi:MAG TPA: hypothetical protein ENJ33_08525 [Thiothrix sp.]|nr:hypothetical protein [Thiothrix sp.]